MEAYRKTLLSLMASAVIGLLAMPSVAETTVADYDRLKKPDQAALVGRFLQVFVDNLQKENRNADAQCISDLYTKPPVGSKKGLSVGMMEFLDLVQLARETEPGKYTIERIIVSQANAHCSSEKKKAPR